MLTQKIKFSKKDIIISFFITFICLVVSIYLFFIAPDVSGYENLGILPLFFGLANILFFFIYSYKKNLALIAIMLLEFFRMVIIPIFIILGNGYTAIPTTANEYISFAIGLMIYELFAILCVIGIYIFSNNKKNEDINKELVNSRILKIILFFMLSFMFLVHIIYPKSVTAFKSIFEVTDKSFTSWYGSGASNYSAGAIERILMTVYTMVFSWVRYLLPIGIIIWVKKHVKNDFLKIIISLGTIGIQMFLITATIMDSILCAFVLFIVLVKYYPRYRKLLLILSVILLLVLIGGYFLIRFSVNYNSNSNFMKFISENANAYVGGVANIAAIKLVPKEYKFETLFFNIYGAIPFNTTLFGLKGNKLAAIYNMSINRVDGQIPPTIGASYYYFGLLLAPLESMIYTWIAMKFGEKALYEKNIWKYMSYILVSFMCVMAFTTYNSAIVLNYATTLLIPILILCRYTRDNDFYF